MALDFAKQTDTWKLLEQLDPQRCAVKVGSEMFTLFGPEFVRRLISDGFRVFLDLKFHDIPNTVAHACRASADLGVWMVNVHVSGGPNMLEAAREAIHAYGAARPLLIGVTVLTSLDATELLTVGIAQPLPTYVSQLAKLAQTYGLDGVVSSALEVPLIKNQCGKTFLTITPGIRFASQKQDDQSRIITPQAAIASGSDYIVVGRPITQAVNPLAVVDEILRYV